MARIDDIFLDIEGFRDLPAFLCGNSGFHSRHSFLESIWALMDIDHHGRHDKPDSDTHHEESDYQSSEEYFRFHDVHLLVFKSSHIHPEDTAQTGLLPFHSPLLKA
jgi:hypothetical protein